MPTLLRIGVSETVAYRAEFLVWILTTTQPLIMMGLWTSVAREQPFHGYSADAFTAYYLSTLIVRQLTGNWVAWQMSEEVRMGVMSMRLLRPIHPFFAFAASHIAAIPFRTLGALPLAVILLVSSGASALATDPVQLALLPVSIALAWLITFALLFSIGEWYERFEQLEDAEVCRLLDLQRSDLGSAAAATGHQASRAPGTSP
jgi:ABC-2 type transport system permease protein